MENQVIIVSKKEQEKCDKILELFNDYLENRNDLCVVKTNKFGYIVLQYIVNGNFDCNEICDTAEKLYNSLFSKWEVDALYDMANGVEYEDMEDLVGLLTIEQKTTLQNQREYYSISKEKILNTKS